MEKARADTPMSGQMQASLAAAAGTGSVLGLAHGIAYKFYQNQKERKLWKKQGLTLPTKEKSSLHGLYAHPKGSKKHINTHTTIGGFKRWLKEGKKRGKPYLYWSLIPPHAERTIGGVKHWLKDGKEGGKSYSYWSTTPPRALSEAEQKAAEKAAALSKSIQAATLAVGTGALLMLGVDAVSRYWLGAGVYDVVRYLTYTPPAGPYHEVDEDEYKDPWE